MVDRSILPVLDGWAGGQVFEWEEGEKGQTGYLKNPQQGKNPKQHQKWTTFLEPSKTKHIFGLSGRLLFLGMERGEEVKCTNVTLHSTNCIESFAAEGVLPRRDELKFEQRTVFFFDGKGVRGRGVHKYNLSSRTTLRHSLPKDSSATRQLIWL